MMSEEHGTVKVIKADPCLDGAPVSVHSRQGRTLLAMLEQDYGGYERGDLIELLNAEFDGSD